MEHHSRSYNREASRRRAVKILWISGSNIDQVGDTQAVIESQLMVIVGDEYKGYRVKLWSSHINKPLR